MEVDNTNYVKKDNASQITPSPTPAPHPTPDPYTAALLEMEARLTCSMKEMLEPLKTDINSLVLSLKEWEQ